MCGIVGFMNTEHLEENILDKIMLRKGRMYERLYTCNCNKYC